MKDIPLSQIYPGVILLAAPNCFLDQKTVKYSEAVIVIKSKSRFEIEGLVINRKENESEEGEFIYYNGGEQNRNVTSIIHAIPDEIGSDIEINERVYVGGNISKVESLVDLRMVDDRDIRLFRGLYSWEPKELSAMLRDRRLLLTDIRMSYDLLRDARTYKYYDSSYLWGKMYELYMKRNPLQYTVFARVEVDGSKDRLLPNMN